MVQLTPEMKRLVDSESGTVSREIFWNQDLYDQEMEQVFNRSWLFVATSPRYRIPETSSSGGWEKRRLSSAAGATRKCTCS